jgi:hypothetical protein
VFGLLVDRTAARGAAKSAIRLGLTDSAPTSAVGPVLGGGPWRELGSGSDAELAIHLGQFPGGMLGQVDPMAALIEHGMLLESARGPLPNVAEMIAGEPIRGSWWSHPAGHAIFAALNSLAESPDVVRTRLVNGKVTLVHRRLWPAMVRAADRLPLDGLAAIREEHTTSGAHRVREQPFPTWVPADVLQAAKDLSMDDAFAKLPECLGPTR